MSRNLRGWLPERPDYRDFPYEEIKPKRIRVPQITDLSKKCSPIEDQGYAGSCVGESIIGATEFLDMIDGGKFTNDSVLFAYWIARAQDGFQGEDNGAFIRSGIRAMSKQGCCVDRLWPYDTSKVLVKPPQKCFTEATKHRISSYHKIRSLQEMLECLASGYPFIFGFTCYSAFDSDEVARTGILNMPQPGEVDVGGHAVVGVGANTKEERLLVRNSWGTEWGMDGYFTMPFEYLTCGLANDFWTIRR